MCVYEPNIGLFINRIKEIYFIQAKRLTYLGFVFVIKLIFIYIINVTLPARLKFFLS